MKTVFVVECEYAITGYDVGEADSQCKNGQSYKQDQLCLLNTDQYDIMSTCRDVTHLEHCRELFMLQV